MWKSITATSLLMLAALNGAMAQQSRQPPLDQRAAQPLIQRAQSQFTQPAAPIAQPNPQAIQPRSDAAALHQRGQIVRVDPNKNTIVVRTPDGREIERRLHPNARLFGRDRLLIADGLRFSGFSPGETIWYRLENNDNEPVFYDVRLYDPTEGERRLEAITDVRGQIVRVDPAVRTIVVRTPEREAEYRVADEARVWDANRILIAEGLTYRGLRTGATVWLRLSPADPRMVTEIRLFDPNRTDLYVRGEILSVEPEMHVFVARTAQGDVEYRVTGATQYWDVNRLPLVDGLSYPLFRRGSTVWLRLGTVGSALVVTEMRYYDPSKPLPTVRATPDIRALVVRTDPENRRIVLHVGEGAFATDVEYRVTPNTRYWDGNKVPFTEGLAYRGFRPGAVVWFRLGIEDNGEVITEVRFANPDVLGSPTDWDFIGALGYKTFPPGTTTYYRLVGDGRNLSDLQPDPTLIKGRP